MAGRRVALLGVVAVVALAATACGSAVAGHPAPDPDTYVSRHAPAKLPYLGDEGTVERVFTRMRTWDVCAMHDLKAAKELTGDAVVSVSPLVDLSTCAVSMAKGLDREWNLLIGIRNLGTLAKKLHRGGIVQGSLVYQVHDDHSCSYVLPYQEVAGIQVTAQTTHARKAGDQACALAKSYLSQDMAKLTHPPSLNAMATAPRLELAGKDPCAALAAVKGKFSQPDVKGIVPNPYSCMLSDTGHGSDGAAVRFGFGTANPQKGSQPVEIAGLHGSRKRSATKCGFAFGVGTPIAVDRFSGHSYREVLHVTVPRCGDTATVRKIVGAVHPTPRPAPADPKLRLGVRTGYLARQAGAPFDPCTILTWRAFPKRLREGKHVVHPNAPGKDSLLKAACSFHSASVDTLIGWGSGGEKEIRKHPAFTTAKPVTIAGHTVLRATGKDSAGHPNCAEAVLIDGGFAAVSTSVVSQDSTIDPCLLDKTLIEKLAPKLP